MTAMGMQPLISVIIPVYNVEAYLDECVRSVVNQTYRNLEILLVDDGSTDRSGVLCDAWAARDPRIRVIHKANGGLSDARNAGLEDASGELFSFVDSDDWIGEDFYRILAGRMAERNADAAVANIVRSYADHKEVRDFSAQEDVFTAEKALEVYISGNGISCEAWNKLYRRSLFDGIRFPLNRINEDEFVTYRVIARARGVVFCGNAEYYYRQRAGSIMSSQVKVTNFDFLDAYAERLDFFRGQYPAVYQADSASFCTAIVMRYRSALAQGTDRAVLDRNASYRKRVRFTLRDLSGRSGKELLYIIGTGISVRLFSKLLNLRGIPD